MFLLLLQQYGLVIYNLRNLEFKYFKTLFYDETYGDWHLKYVLDV
jgi:hypothetical protein